MLNEIFPTTLEIACRRNYSEIVALLLARPDIDVNQLNKYDSRPLITACNMGNTSCVRLLLEDSRLEIEGIPCYGAIVDGHLETIKWYIASGRQLDLGEILEYKRLRPLDHQMSSLLRRFKDHPDNTRYRVRLELGCLDKLSADIFALVIFLCDDLLRLKNKDVSPLIRHETVRFLSIMKELPMELQMIICHRAVGSAGTNIASKTAEFGFRQLAKVYMSK